MGVLGGGGEGLYTEVIYDEERWAILWEKRAAALRVMEALMRAGIGSVVYGSVARGDVHRLSDVEVYIPRPVSPVLAETIIEREFGGWIRREVVQATPTYVPKGYIYIDELTVVSFPLAEALKTEEAFYDIAGKLDLEGVRRRNRVTGMNKALRVIIPTSYGHSEFPAERDPELAANLIGVDPLDLRRRISVLTRRREHGKTGVYSKIVLGAGESFSSILNQLLDRNPRIRRRIHG
ncbi:hypothetical protein HRbin02_00457 [Candidatus Calditenuaceae archaeon HR02]|nr:hypothetical protein HRbin02_00457 [Candidatus Calditenuaceae archaeon HR02]